MHSSRVVFTALLGFGLVLPASGMGAPTRLQGNMILNSDCAGDPGCPVDAIKTGKFLLKSSEKAGDGGGAVTVILSGVTRGGVSVTNEFVTVSVRVESGATGSCHAHTYRAPGVRIGNGRLEGVRNVPFGAFAPPISWPPATTIRLCHSGVRIVVRRAPDDPLTHDRIAVDGLLPGPAGGLRPGAKGDLALSGACAGNPACPIDAIKRGKFVVRSSKKAGANGVEFKLLLRGLTRNGEKANLPTAAATIELSQNGGSCGAYLSPSFAVVNGAAKGANRKFTGADLSPALTVSPGSSLRLCGNRISVHADGSPPMVADGLLHGGCGKPECPSVTPIQAQHLASAEQIMGWVETIVAQGIRRPGYAADDWAIQWARDRFLEFGLQDVTLDPIDVRRWQPLQWSLTAWPDDDPDNRLTIPCYPVPYSAPATGLQGSLALAGGGANLGGKIAVVETRFLDLPQTIARFFATWTHDPTSEFDQLVQTLPFSLQFQGVMSSAITAGATGFVGILDVPWETDRYYVPYDAQDRPIPGVWVTRSNGELLKGLLAAGPASGEIVLDRGLDTVTSYNVTGALPGASDEWIIIGSHHDGPWASAVEDGSGMALVIAQAQYWSRVPEQERPHNLLFLLNGGHMAGGAGLIHFVGTNTEWIEEEVLVEIHLEHAAREVRGENGQLVATGDPEVRWWFTGFVPPLEEALAQAICAEDLRRSLMMPPAGFPPGSAHPPTDAAFFHPHAPIVSFLTAPMYLFDEQDTIDKVDEESLVPLSRASIRIVNAMHGHTAEGLRAERYVPPRGTAVPACANQP